MALPAQYPVQVALVAACAPDAALLALLGGTAADPRVYDGAAPEGTPLDYVTLGDTSEGPAGYFGHAGHEGSLLVHVWALGPGRARAAAVHAALAARLDGVRLPITGHRQLTGRLTLVSSRPDPDGVTHHRVLRYTYRTLTAP